MTDELANERLMSFYGRALDEIYALRSLLAYEACVRRADMDLKSYPMSRRKFAEASAERMAAAARGDRRDMPAIGDRNVRVARVEVGMDQILTRAKWEAEFNSGTHHSDGQDAWNDTEETER